MPGALGVVHAAAADVVYITAAAASVASVVGIALFTLFLACVFISAVIHAAAAVVAKKKN
jgi:hypothetical protein